MATHWYRPLNQGLGGRPEPGFVQWAEWVLCWDSTFRTNVDAVLQAKGGPLTPVDHRAKHESDRVTERVEELWQYVADAYKGYLLAGTKDEIHANKLLEANFTRLDKLHAKGKTVPTSNPKGGKRSAPLKPYHVMHRIYLEYIARSNGQQELLQNRGEFSQRVAAALARMPHVQNVAVVTTRNLFEGEEFTSEMRVERFLNTPVPAWMGNASFVDGFIARAMLQRRRYSPDACLFEEVKFQLPKELDKVLGERGGKVIIPDDLE
jgi:hypothetical protein